MLAVLLVDQLAAQSAGLSAAWWVVQSASRLAAYKQWGDLTVAMSVGLMVLTVPMSAAQSAMMLVLQVMNMKDFISTKS